MHTLKNDANSRLWILLALIIIITYTIYKLCFINRPFVGHYDIDGVLYYLLSISFNKYGFYKLGFIPVNNSGPLTFPPDYYAHWPFLYTYVLAGLFKIFGPKVYVGRILTVLASTISFFLMFDIIKKVSNSRLGFFVVFGFIVAPASVYYGFWVGRTVIVVCLWLIAIWNLVSYDLSEGRKNHCLIIACILFGISALISWEPVVTVFGFGIILYLRKEPWFRNGLIFCGISLLLAFLIHHMHILVVAPYLINDQIVAALERAYITSNYHATRPFFNWLFLLGWNMYISFGFILLLCGLLGLTLLIHKISLNCKIPWLLHHTVAKKIAERNYEYHIMIYLILIGAMPLLWFTLMPRQAFDHDYECLLWLPFLSIVAGYFLDTLYTRCNKTINILLFYGLLILILVESFFGVHRLVKEYTPAQYYYLPEVKELLKETDILIGSAPAIPFYTERFVLNVRNKEDLIYRLKNKSLRWVTGVYFIAEYPQNNVGSMDVIKQHNNNDLLLDWLKDKLRYYYKPLPINDNRVEMVEWIKNNFPERTLPSGIIIYDLTGIVKGDYAL